MRLHPSLSFQTKSMNWTWFCVSERHTGAWSLYSVFSRRPGGWIFPGYSYLKFWMLEREPSLLLSTLYMVYFKSYDLFCIFFWSQRNISDKKRRPDREELPKVTFHCRCLVSSCVSYCIRCHVLLSLHACEISCMTWFSTTRKGNDGRKSLTICTKLVFGKPTTQVRF